ncbi:MAG: glycerol-3-phosphate dehydrogenase/oxidase [Acidimicrobiales bacterium]|nr:glycerol-3-phosphate dehydrogenase/oxidase [Acidimicrobiales bacterium]
MIGPGWFDRADALRRMEADGVDVLVVGGGITGAGCALDAASRGLRVGLVERDDFASGTSSKSSKLVHGGLRYLQQGEVRLVYEALHERQRLLRNAPHLVSVLPFLIPMFTGKGGVLNPKLSRALGSAMWMYDLTGGLRIGRRHQRISVDETLAHVPTLDRDRLAPSYLYYDAQADDARLTLTIARTAAIDHGAAVANGTALVGLDKDASGRVVAARLAADGREFAVACDAVVNAGGVWSDGVRALDEGHDPDSIRPAKGVHITVPWRLVQNDIAAVIPVPGDKRSVFVVPWGDLTYIGTTDTDYDGPVDDPPCTAEDIAYLLKAINGATTAEITEADVVGTWAGLRPLVKSATSGRTADLSRRHKVAPSASGVVTITGGKLTTYREMAADTIDAVVDLLPGDQPRRVRRTRTQKLRLRGADGFEALLDGADERTSHLAHRYGGEARTVLALIEGDPSLGEPLVEGLPYLRAEAVYAARHEMARSVDDVLSRRTRARLLARDASGDAAPDVGALIAPELGLDADAVAAQVDAYRGLLDRERAGNAAPSDAAAPA